MTTPCRLRGMVAVFPIVGSMHDLYRLVRFEWLLKQWSGYGLAHTRHHGCTSVLACATGVHIIRSGTQRERCACGYTWYALGTAVGTTSRCNSKAHTCTAWYSAQVHFVRSVAILARCSTVGHVCQWCGPIDDVYLAFAYCVGVGG